MVIVLWQIGYSRATFVPAPIEVWKEFRETIPDPATYTDVWVSLRRLFFGLFLGFGVGFLTSVQAARNARFERMLMPYVRITLTLPSLLVALLSLVVFGISDLGVLTVVAVIVFPFVVIQLLQGMKHLDHAQIEMARVYNATTSQIVRGIALPHLAPYLFSAFRNGHAHAWKVLIVGEVFSVRSGIGHRFQRAFGQFDLPEVMIWLIIFLVVIGFTEYAVLGVLERWVFRWRPKTDQKWSRPEVPRGARRIDRQ